MNENEISSGTEDDMRILFYVELLRKTSLNGGYWNRLLKEMGK